MGAYLIAAEGTNINAMLGATKAFLQQKVKRDNHTFAPSAAEFAEQCRYHEPTPDRPKEISNYRPVRHEFKDWGIIHRMRAAELESQGWEFIGTMPKEQYVIQATRRNLRPGTIHLWATESVWSPPA